MSSNRILKPVKRFLRILPDRVYIQLYYFAKFRRFCDLQDPSTYSEKLQWLKLNYRVPEHAKLVDKYAVKGIVEDRVGADHVIPTLAIYDDVNDISFDALPNSFVLKCTHDSEGVIFVNDKYSANTEKIKDELRRALSQNFFFIGREPHYRDIQPRVIVEPLLEDKEHGQLLDYKFLCFDGKVKAMFIASDRGSGKPKFDYFDVDFSPLNMRQSYPTSRHKPTKPKQYETMVAIAQELAKGHPHVRVDLYEVNGQVYFGELTFFHFSGFAPFEPADYDKEWGSWLSLPQASNAS